MGVYCELRSATPAHLSDLARAPRLLSLFWDAAEMQPRPSLISRLFRRGPRIPPSMQDISESMAISLDKAWHGLHFLLTGSAVGGSLPQAFLLECGRTLDPNSRFFTPSEAAAIGHYISSVTEASLRARFDPCSMERADVYPAIIWVRDGSEALDWLLEFWDRVPSFFRDVQAEGHGVIVTIS